MRLAQDSPGPVVLPQQSENFGVVEHVAPAPDDSQEFWIRAEPFQQDVKLASDLCAGGGTVDVEHEALRRFRVSYVVVGRSRVLHADHIGRYAGQAPLSEGCLNIRWIHLKGDHCGWCRTLPVLGVAMETGADVAMQAAGITLTRGDPLLIGDAIAVSRATYARSSSFGEASFIAPPS
jgi:hypothetical protein